MGVRRFFARLAAPALIALSSACGGGIALAPQGVAPQGVALSGARWIPEPRESYQIQYDGRLDLTVKAKIYDLDMFDTPARIVKELHGMGRRVMCYVDVGTWERWRPDARDFPKSVLGRPDGQWPGERWLDIRATKILEPIMSKRLDLCKSKGFDGVDPDNLDGYQNRTGFPLTYGEQLKYDAWVARAAHARGLTADQKGDNGQVKDLVKVPISRSSSSATRRDGASSSTFTRTQTASSWTSSITATKRDSATTTARKPRKTATRLS